MPTTSQANTTSGLSERVLELFAQMQAISHSQTIVHRRVYDVPTLDSHAEKVTRDNTTVKAG